MTLIEIFKAGKRLDAHGTVVEITPADLQQAVEAYDVAYHEAPAVIGHPTMEAPRLCVGERLAVRRRCAESRA